VIAPTPARRAAVIGLLAAAALAQPTLALADDARPSGGAAVAAPAAAAPAPTSTEEQAPTAAAPADQPGTWRAAPTTVVGKPVLITGRFPTSLAGHRVRVERRDARGTWRRAKVVKVRSNGRFVARWTTRAVRYHELRVVVLDRAGKAPVADTAGSGASARSSSGSAIQRIVVLGSSVATWYGPGFYGRRTACGQTLTAATEGVAHRTLPCGTKVEVRRGGRSVVVPVIDRGPFANDADFDLTKNVADELGVSGVNRVRYVVRDDLEPVDAPAS